MDDNISCRHGFGTHSRNIKAPQRHLTVYTDSEDIQGDGQVYVPSARDSYASGIQSLNDILFIP